MIKSAIAFRLRNVNGIYVLISLYLLSFSLRKLSDMYESFSSMCLI
jgi:hypothetical protein